MLYLITEGHVEGYHDGRVERKEQYDPVPACLEGRVVKYDVLGRLRSLLFVLRQQLATAG